MICVVFAKFDWNLCLVVVLVSRLALVSGLVLSLASFASPMSAM